MTANLTIGFAADVEGQAVRLRTLTILRWIAIAGQTAALVVASERFGVQIDVGLCLVAIGASVLVNLVTAFIFPPNAWLTPEGATLALLFDIMQLGALLYLTGGLENPFAFLILVPVTISASVLQLWRTAVLGGLAIAVVSVLVFLRRPLVTEEGVALELPATFAFGFWLAIVIGIVFLGAYAYRVSLEIRSMRLALLAAQMALAREQKLTDLGGVIAAAAHELGTPLATIKLVSAELIDDLADRPAQREDAELIREQADRCRDILRTMGSAGKQDLHMQQVPLTEVLREAAEPHLGRGKKIDFATKGETAEMPMVARSPEIIHGMRNFIQNAVDFANERILVEADWTASHVRVRIVDDGPGFPAQVIGRIGDPFVRSRRGEQGRSDGTVRGPERPGYEGMGLGLFIAKTLLVRTGGELTFANGTPPLGAIVEIVWPRDVIALPKTGALGKNPQLLH